MTPSDSHRYKIPCPLNVKGWALGIWQVITPAITLHCVAPLVTILGGAI